MREVEIELMWRYIGALRHVTHVTEITLVDYLFVVGFVDTVDLHGFAVIDQVE
jgi:hypothetical protein